MTRVVVVGGGIAGLAAARALGAAAADSGLELHITLREESDRIGGHLSTSPFAGRPAVDESADAFLARVPHATALAGIAGVHGLVSPAVQRAAVWHGRLHDIPDGTLLGIPGRLAPVLRTSLLSWRAKATILTEPFRARVDAGDSIGALVRGRFGAEVHDRLVDSLVGSIYAADTDHLSLAMVPQLEALAGTNRSLLLGARAATRRRPDGPVFLAPEGGMADLACATAGAATRLGVDVRSGTPVRELSVDGGAWRVDGEATDAVILACPAARASRLFSGNAAPLAELLSVVEAADVAIVTIATATERWPERLRGRSGYIVAKSVQRSVTAVSFASQKWAHLADGRTEVLRISIGRDGAPFDGRTDEELLATAVKEVSAHIGVDLDPIHTRVSRWPRSFPQYRPGHRTWLAAVDAATPPGLTLAGASYHGIGVPACIESGETAAAVTLDRLLALRQ
ncbi:MAG: protoporphyrinogen oxidase [Actinomycetota bacterium]|nr:protoporphyrinogen oxidase [Actinomycetota bacterium]